MLAHYKKNLQAKLLLTGLLALFASFVRAQGLGELTLESALNEPLRASIELVNVAGLNRDQLQLSIGTESEYEQAGLEKHPLLNNIVMVVEQQQGRSRVILTTEARVQEPYLILLVSARWPSGRVMRDYTVLLDLPTFRSAGSGSNVQAAAAPVVPAASSTNNTQTAPAPRAAAIPVSPGSDTYTVASGDSLWEIAEQTRPSTAVSVQQMMVAIQRANEDAFVNNNINRLLSGRVLRIPTAQEIGTVAQGDAVARINAQNQELGLVRLDGSGAAAGPSGSRDELSVISAEDAVVQGAGSTDLAATIAALETELMMSEEELDRVRFENEELYVQLGELEQQIAILQNIIAIEDERMASLQAELGAQAEQAPAPQAMAQSAMATTTNVLPVSTQAAQPQGLADQVLTALQNNLVSLVAVVLVLLLVLGFLVHRARKMREFEEDDLAFMRQDDSARGATRIETVEESEGLFAGLLARFRRDKDDDDEDDYEDEDEDEDEDDDDYTLGDESLERPEDDFILDTQEVDDFAPIVDETDAQDSGSLADELSELDFDEDEDEDEFLTDLTLDDDTAVESPEVAEDALEEFEIADEIETEIAAEEVTREIEFELPAEDTLEIDESVSAEADEGEIETFEFKLAAKPPVQEAAAAPASPVADVETIAFNSTPARTEEPAPELDLDITGFEDTDLRLDDDSMDDDQQSVYQPRTNMDECDTKLDLAVAYEAMGDIDGAIEILDEVIAEGKPAQIEAARGFKSKWQES